MSLPGDEKMSDEFSVGGQLVGDQFGSAVGDIQSWRYVLCYRQGVSAENALTFYLPQQKQSKVYFENHLGPLQAR